MKKIITLVVLATLFITCNKEGCTDPTATNYNAEASTDDGTCTIEGCTDPNAVNYDSNANVSTDCIYDQVGSWTTTRQDYEISTLVIYLGDTILDTNYIEVTPSDSLDPTRIDFKADGMIIEYYIDGEVDSTSSTWTVSNSSNNSINYINNDGSMTDTTTLNIESVNSNFMRLTATESELDTSDPDGFASFTLNIIWEFSRN
tara:strand:- start:841 stop:1446 length:606 start_codon:yes stop_codon:yes gene_type:complete